MSLLHERKMHLAPNVSIAFGLSVVAVVSAWLLACSESLPPPPPEGMPPDDAVRRIRNERPMSLETTEQAEVVHRYFRYRQETAGTATTS